MWPRQLPDMAQIGGVFLVLGPFFALAGNSASDIWLSLVAISFLAYSAVKRDWSWASAIWFRVAFLFWVWLLVASIFSDWPQNSLNAAAPWIRFPVFAAGFAYWLCAFPKLRDMTMKAAFVALSIMLLALLFERLRDPTALRLYGTLGQHPKAGWYLLGIGMPVLFWVLHRARTQPNDYRWALPFAVFVLLSMVSTGEVFSTLLLFAATALFLVMLRVPSLILLLSISFCVLMFVALYFISDDLFVRFTSNALTRLPWLPSSDYYLPWMGGIQMGIDNWLTGVGPDNYDPYCRALAVEGGPAADRMPPFTVETCPTHPHNLYIQAFAEAGILGLVLFGALAANLLKRTWHPSGWQKIEFGAIASFVIMVAAFWPISTYSEAFGQHKNFFTWYLIGWALGLQHLSAVGAKSNSHAPQT